MNNPTNNSAARARVQRPERAQIEWREVALNQLLPSDHRARLVWRYVEQLDLSEFFGKIRAVEGHPGRDAVDPRILLTLWIFATIEGISSARHLARLCERDLAYRWICGGVSVNHHLLSDFYGCHGDTLKDLLTKSIATLMHKGLVQLDTVAQDGMRVRANAGSSSFRRKKTLEDCLRETRVQVERLAEENAEASNAASETQRRAAQQRAAEDCEERVKQALEELDQLQQQKEKRKKGSGEKARCSTTDPECRVMKMGDGGYRPAYNVQFATDGDSRLIVGVEVTNSGSDRKQMSLMHEQLQADYGKIPKNYLVDAGFSTHEQVTTVERRGTKVYAPIFSEKEMRKRGKDPYARQKRDNDATYAFRQRMATDEAKELYKQRSAIAEFPNAGCRNHGLHQFRVRGLLKAKASAIWHVLALNFQQLTHLGWI